VCFGISGGEAGVIAGLGVEGVAFGLQRRKLRFEIRQFTRAGAIFVKPFSFRTDPDQLL
jgi:hypothetical protein